MNFINQSILPKTKSNRQQRHLPKSDLTDEGAKKLIQTLIASQLSTTTQFDLDFTAHDDGTKSGKKGKSGKSSEDNEGMDNFKDS